MRKSLYLLVLAVVLIAGCASGDKTQMQNSELLRISGVTVTPGTVVAPGEIITIRMKLENIGQEDVKFVWKNPCKTFSSCELNTGQTGSCPNTEAECTKLSTCHVKYKCDKDIPLSTATDKTCIIDSCSIAGLGTMTGTATDDKFGTMANILYDHCGDLYKPQSFTAITEGFEGKGTQLILKPSRSALLEWTLKAPSETMIANMQHECTFRFQINYQARAETYTYIYFANPDEKNQRTYTNKDMNLRGENVANFGPVYINFETAQDQPIKGSDSKTNNTWTLYVTARNVGDGIGRIAKGTLQIDLPKQELKPDDTSTACDDFKAKSIPLFSDPINYSGDDSRLKLYSKQSSRFSCTLPAPKVDVLEPYRFISSAEYTYTIDKEVKILTVPKR